MTREGTGVAIDPTQLISSLFALIPVPVAVIDQTGRVVLSNSAFADLFHDIQNIQSVPHHELELAGRGTYELETVPLNDRGMKIIYASEITNEVQLRRQVVHLEKMAAIGRLVSGAIVLQRPQHSSANDEQGDRAPSRQNLPRQERYARMLCS